jgi:Uma2 family endonuclease
MATRTLVTADELLAMPRGRVRRELIRGELFEMNPAGADHGTVAMRIGRLVDEYAAVNGGRAFAAETGFKVETDPDTVRAPDAAYVTPEHAAARGHTRGFWVGPPDFAVEVVSPNDTYAETHEKALMWLAHGASVVLVASPVARHVTRYRSREDIVAFTELGDTVDCAPAMPGFAPTVAELIPEL